MKKRSGKPAKRPRDSGKLFRALVERGSDAVALIDAQGTLSFVGGAITPLLGYRPDELVGDSAFALLHPDDLEPATDLFRRLREEPGIPITAEVRCRHKDGSYRQIEAVGVNRLDDPAVGAIVATYRDVTERKRIEAELRVLVESVQAVVWRSDARTFRFSFVSREVEPLLGYPPERWTSEPAFWLDHVHPDDRGWAAAYCRAETDQLRPHEMEYRMLAADGRVVWVRDVIRVLAEQGRPKELVGVMLDITARKRAEQVQAATYRIAQATIAAPDLPALLAAIHETVGELMSARNFYIAVHDPANGLLSFPYFVDEFDAGFEPRPLGRGLTDYVLRTGASLLATPDVYDRLVAAGEVELIGAPSIDWLGVPLKAQGRTIGVIVAQSYTAGLRYGEAERHILEFVSTQVAQAIERRRAADELREQTELLQRIVDHVPVMLAIFDARGRIVWGNGEWTRVLGYTLEEARGQDFFAQLYPDPAARARVFETMGAPPGRWTDFRTTLRDGRMIETSWANVPLPVGGNLAIGMDVTERRRAEQALRQAEERYRMFITQSTEGIWRFEPDEPIPVTLPADQQVERCFAASRLAECNDAIAQMYGYASASELVGAPLGDLLARTDPKNVELLRAFVQAGYRLADVESHEVDRNGRPKTFLNNLVGLVEDGRLVRVWGTQRDVTEARQLEEQLRRAQKMEAVGRLAGGIAHDFNNILTAILGTTQLLDRELAPDSAARPDIGEIRKAAERAADLTRQLLAYSRQQVLAPRVLDVHAAVRGLGPMLRRLIGEDVELVTEADSAPARAKADPGQLEQVIVNLVVNARDAMPRGGRLTITTGSVELDGAAAVGTPPPPPGRYVRVAVIDTGTGMTDEVRAHLFEPFFTTKDVGKGTGLGLATVYGIVKQSGGFIYVDSEVGRGTAIRMYLPAVDAPVSRPTPAPPTARIARASETLLLVEDEEAVRTLARRALEAQGYQVLAAASGPEALALAERHAGPIHALVTDVVMPGMSGPEVARRLSATRPAMQVLYTSGYTEDATVHHGLEEGATAFLQKPFEPDSLTAKVRQVLDRPA